MSKTIVDDYYMRLIEGEIRPIGFPMVKGIKERPTFSMAEELAESFDGTSFLATHDLPELSKPEISAFAVRKILEPFKKPCGNGFGSRWNEITARAACQSLGKGHLNTKKILRILAQETAKALQLKARQAEIAALFETTIETKVAERLELFSLEAAKNAWVKEKMAIAERFISQFPLLTKSRRREIKINAVRALINFTQKFGNQTFNRTEFLQRIITSMAEDKPLRLIDIHCPPLKHNQKGVSVIPSAKDQRVKNAKGGTIVISQWDILNEIRETAQMLEGCGIKTEVTIAVVDIDAFVIGDQSQNIGRFCRSLSQEISQKNFEAEINLASNLLGIDDLEDIKTEKAWRKWKEMRDQARKKAMRLIDTEFGRLQGLTASPEMKTRRFATWMAGRKFVVHFLLGKNLSSIFPNGIIMIRGRGSEVIEIDKLGAKEAGARPFIVQHWRDRKVE